MGVQGNVWRAGWFAALIVVLGGASGARGAVGTLADSSGEVVAWGLNHLGQTIVPAGTFKAVAAGGYHSLGIRSDGTLAGWGSNFYGETTVPGGMFTAIEAGTEHSLGIKSDGTLVGWGDNLYGQATVPGGTFMAVAAGGFHSLGITSDGTLAGWGRNNFGQTTVPADTFTAIAAAGYHSLGIKSDGTPAGWGDNSYGQTTVPAGTFTAIAAGSFHSLGIKSDGTLAGWGRNDLGQTTVPTGTFTAIAAGADHNLGIKSDGTLAGWGSNFYGETTVPGGTFTAVAAGAAYNLALRARTDYDGDLLITGSGMTANLNRSINVAGDATVRNASLWFYNNPTATVSGRLIIDGVSMSGNGAIVANGVELKTNFDLYNSVQLASTGPLTGAGNLTLQNYSRLNIGLGSPGLYSGSIAIAPGAALIFNGQGLQTAGALDVFNGGELRMAGGQTVRFGGFSTNSNAGAIHVLGSLAAGPGEIEFVGAFDNAVSTGFIAGQNAVMRFFGGLANEGSLALSSGVNNVFGDISNQAGATITVTGGAGATFYDDIVQNSTFRVAKVGSTVSTAVVLGAFSGSGGSTGGGDIFFEGDLRPGNSPAIVTFANNVALGNGATTHIELGGTTAGTQYDRIAVTGDLSLDGILRVSLINGFQPSAGQSFDILDFMPASISGTFSSVVLDPLAGSLAWDTSQLYTSGVLSVASAGVPGDYNNNGTVDAADYVLWRKGGPLSNEVDAPGTVNGDDYTAWRARFGNSGGGAGAGSGDPRTTSSVPEPAAMVLCLAAIVAIALRRSGCA